MKLLLFETLFNYSFESSKNICYQNKTDQAEHWVNTESVLGTVRMLLLRTLISSLTGAKSAILQKKYRISSDLRCETNSCCYSFSIDQENPGGYSQVPR